MSALDLRAVQVLLCDADGNLFPSEEPAFEASADVTNRLLVTEHLGRALRPDPAVSEPLRELGDRYRLAAVSSSASQRLDACFRATGLAALFPPEVRFSAEDSLPVPASKPDPAIYEHAGAALGIAGSQGLAVEDAVPGVQSAVAAGFPVLGNVMFVPPGERSERSRALLEAGAADVIDGWRELAAMPALQPDAR